MAQFLDKSGLTYLWSKIKAIVATCANKSQGVFYIEGTGSTAGTWLGSHDDITKYYSGLMIAYKVGIAGASTTTLNINNLGAKQVVRLATSAITTHYPVGTVVFLVYTVDSSGTAYWKCADYDSNTKNTAGTTNKASTKMYLVGATSQASNPTTYSNSKVYIGTDNCLYSNSAKVLTTSDAYTHPTYTSKSSGLYKITVDGTGHVSDATAVVKSDITGLGIPAQDTTYSAATQSANGLMSSSDKKKLDGIESGANNVTVYPAANCTTYTSDSGTCTPLAVQNAAKKFAITRPSSTTNKAITRYSNTTGDVQDSKIIIEDVTNTRDTSKKAQVISIPAEGGKKMVYGYCTDQIDGTSFIGGVFDASATAYPYNQGLAIGGTSGNLLWKGVKVATISDIPSSVTPSAHNQAASTITAGTFAGQVVANSSGQAYNTSLLRNTKLVSSDATPTVNGEINWLYS